MTFHKGPPPGEKEGPDRKAGPNRKTPQTSSHHDNDSQHGKPTAVGGAGGNGGGRASSRSYIQSIHDMAKDMRLPEPPPPGRQSPMWAGVTDADLVQAGRCVECCCIITIQGHADYCSRPPQPTREPAKAAPPEPPQPPVYADRVLTRSALRELPNPEPLIDNVLDQGTTALLYGRWGTAKSFIALDWGLCVGTGRKWQGRHVERRRTLYVAGEGAFGFKGRVDAWEVGWHTEIGDDDFTVLPFPVNLRNTVDVLNLSALIDWGAYSFVILDTLARCMVGGDENSAKDCGIVVDSMVRLLARTPGGRGCVLGAHHAGKDGKTLRGSSAFEGAADTVYFSSRDGAVITLDREKRKDGPEVDRHQFVIDPMEGTNSAVISVHRGGGQTDRGKQLLSTFVQHFAQTGASKAELRMVSDMSQGSFYRALSDLLESGDLVNVGTDKRPFYKGRSE